LTDIHVWGLIKGIRIDDDVEVTAGEIVGDVMDEGLLLVAAGPSVVRFFPPLIIDCDRRGN
jgi:acetylornithine aminotransferase